MKPSKSYFAVESYGMSNVGMKRSQNEDSYLLNDPMGVYFIADGMGGHVGGEYASRLAVTTIEEVLRHFTSDPEATMVSGVESLDDICDQLKFAVREASRRIYEEACQNPSLRGMGTTAVGVVIQDKTAYFANVGDSRAYLIRADDISQITKDHSLVSEQVREGILDEDEARRHKYKNIITRSVGFQESVEVDLDSLVLSDGDILALCSDGLSNMVEDHEIRDFITQNDLVDACKEMIDLANRRGGDDNITVILLQVYEMK